MLAWFRKRDAASLEARRDVSGLIELLHSKKSWLEVVDAADALGRLADARAVEPLTGLLQRGTSDARRAATRALTRLAENGALGGQATLISVSKALPFGFGFDSDDGALAHALIEQAAPDIARTLLRDRPDLADVLIAPSLVKLGVDAAAGLLVEGLRAPEPRGALAVMRNIARCADAAPNRERSAVYGSLRPLLADSSIVDALIETVRDPKHRSSELIAMLAVSTDPRVIPVLVEMLPHEPLATATALVRLAGPQAGSFFTQVITNSSKWTQQYMAEALHQVGWTPEDPSLSARLMILRRDLDGVVAAGASMTGPLIDALRDDISTIWTLQALAKVGDYTAVAPLAALVASPRRDYEIQEQIIEDMVARSLEELLTRTASDVPEAVLRGVSRLEDFSIEFWPTKDGESYHGVGRGTLDVSLAKVRELATRELAQRQ